MDCKLRNISLHDEKHHPYAVSLFCPKSLTKIREPQAIVTCDLLSPFRVLLSQHSPTFPLMLLSPVSRQLILPVEYSRFFSSIKLPLFLSFLAPAFILVEPVASIQIQNMCIFQKKSFISLNIKYLVLFNFVQVGKVFQISVFSFYSHFPKRIWH